MREWERYGFEVEVARGINRFIDADIVIPHLDLTIWPEEYINFFSRYPVVVNRHAGDISKSRISSNIIGRDEEYQGPVIIKSNRNFGGLPENRLISKPVIRLMSKAYIDLYAIRFLMRFPNFIPWKRISYLDPTSYPIYKSVKDVPAGVFENKNLIVERFLPERDGEHYCRRMWIFLGDKGINVLSKSKKKIAKSSNSCSIEHVSVPEELFSIRRRLKFDYGIFDYVIRDGKVILFDINWTIASRGYKQGNFARQAARLIAGGIWSFYK